MRRVVAVLAVVCLATSAFGGTVQFDPPKVDLPHEGGLAKFDIVLHGDGVFDAADIVIGSNDMPLGDFAYAQEFRDAMNSFVVDPPYWNNGIYASDVFVGGSHYDTQDPTVGPDLRLGQVWVDATGLPKGEYYVHVNSDNDDALSTLWLEGVGEGLVGMGVVNVVPEPAAIVLLGLGAIGLLRRRK